MVLFLSPKTAWSLLVIDMVMLPIVSIWIRPSSFNLKTISLIFLGKDLSNAFILLFIWFIICFENIVLMMIVYSKCYFPIIIWNRWHDFGNWILAIAKYQSPDKIISDGNWILNCPILLSGKSNDEALLAIVIVIILNQYYLLVPNY